MSLQKIQIQRQVTLNVVHLAADGLILTTSITRRASSKALSTVLLWISAESEGKQTRAQHHDLTASLVLQCVSVFHQQTQPKPQDLHVLLKSCFSYRVCHTLEPRLH